MTLSQPPLSALRTLAAIRLNARPAIGDGRGDGRLLPLHPAAAWKRLHSSVSDEVLLCVP